KAGGDYCPVATELPFERIRQILADSRAPVLIAHSRQRDLCRRLRIACPDLETVLFIDQAEESRVGNEGGGGEWSAAALDAHAGDERIDRGQPNSMAYVMYTSGTSGAPKGVVVEHRSVLRLVLNTNYVRLGPDDRILLTGSLAFDASTFELWGALLNGGHVFLARRQ